MIVSLKSFHACTHFRPSDSLVAYKLTYLSYFAIPNRTIDSYLRMYYEIEKAREIVCFKIPTDNEAGVG